jgi:TetR/AcrR family transcriptional repressor of nem operon
VDVAGVAGRERRCRTPRARVVDAEVEHGRASLEEQVDGAENPLAAFVDAYLSTDHRDDPGTGCTVVALGADAARADDRVRATYRAQVEQYIADMEALLGGDEETRRRAIAAVSSMVGALLISRAIDDEELSDEILREVRATVEADGR